MDYRKASQEIYVGREEFLKALESKVNDKNNIIPYPQAYFTAIAAGKFALKERRHKISLTDIEKAIEEESPKAQFKDEIREILTSTFNEVKRSNYVGY